MSNRCRVFAISGLITIAGVLYSLILLWFFTVLMLRPLAIAVLLTSLLLILYVAATTLNIRYRCNGNSVPSTETVLFLIAAGMMPSILLFHYVALNSANFNMMECIFMCFLFGMINITAYLFITLKGNRGIALILLLLAWAVFWFYPFVISLYPNKLLFWLVCLVLFGVTLALSLISRLNRVVAYALASVICMLFIYNFVCAALRSVQYKAKNDELYQPKTTFTVAENTEHPDIYWFHMDGMMGFDEIERLFGDSQEDLKSGLSDRGFVINESAILDIGWTAFSIPGLTSPTIYDNYIRDRMISMPDYNGAERKAALGDEALAIYNIYPQLELFNAFSESDYSTYYAVYDIGRGMEKVPADYLFSSAINRNTKSSIVELLAGYSLLSMCETYLNDIIVKHAGLANVDVDNTESKIFSYVNPNSDYQFNSIEHYDWIIASMFERIKQKESPKLTYLQNLLPHFPFKYDENGTDTGTEAVYDMNRYMDQHRYAVKIMIGMIDRVIETNKDAIIIIQADHGVHGAYSRSELGSQGYSNKDILAMNYSTISAVRIPKKYGTLNSPLDPLDITRYLVNNYVGEGNYEYLYYRNEE